MKKIALLFSCINICFSFLQAQDTEVQRQLIETQLELIKAKQEIIKTQLNELDSKAQELQKRDSYKVKQTNRYLKNINNHSLASKTSDTLKLRKPTHIFFLNPVRLFEGGFDIGIERPLNESLTIDASIIMTYVTQNGLGGQYLRNNSLEYYDAASSSYFNYSGNMLTGFGTRITLKKYLNPYSNANILPLKGFHAGLHLMYRKTFIEGIEYYWEDNEYKEQIIKQNLDIFSTGVTLGYQWHINNILSIDIFAGGVIRLSKYINESTFTKFKKWNNIDYSGVLPTAGIKIGILQ